VKTVGVAVALLLGLSLLPPAGAVAPSSTVRVAFLRGEQLALVRRPGVDPADALRGLLAGPTRAETGAGYRTYVPSGTRVLHLTVEHGTATADMNRRFVSGRPEDRLLAAVTQLVATLSSVRAVDRVQLLADGKPVRRVIAGISLSSPITLEHLQTPNIPVPGPPAYRLRPPDAATLTAQQQLIRLGYLLAGDADGRFGPTTSEGILAFQKFEGLALTSVIDARTRAALATATAPVPITHGGPGKRAEILLDRQVALLIQDDRVVRAIAVSTGKPSTPTPPGSYRVYAKIPRWWSTPFREWLPWALPFVGGIAFHEFAVVPVYPASHGCVRQSYTVARWTYDFAEVGMPVRVLGRM
jgi:hypothetical protein